MPDNENDYTLTPINGNNNTLEPVSRVDGFLINKGQIVLEPEFDNFETHVNMCYEYSKDLLFGPSDSNDDNFGSILICTEWVD